MLFGELFKDMSMDELHARYYKAKSDVEGKWYELMQHRVNVSELILRTYMWSRVRTSS
jgi:hypothetical protein